MEVVWWCISMDESLALLGLLCKKNIKWNDLKDKPFYEIKKDFRTGEIKTDFESGNALVPLDINPNDFQLEVDTRIIVKWNGIEYPLITKTHSVTDYDVYWGNGALLMPMLEDTGEPFFFRRTISGSSLGFNIISTLSSATWEIIVPDYYTELKTIDTKYLPKTLQFGDGEPIVVVPETTVTAGPEGVPIGDYTDLIKVGTTCIVTFNGTDYECVAYEFNIAPGVLIIGNANFLELGLDGGNEEPFVITNNAGAGLILGAGEGEVTVSVKAKPIITIDDKYLPETAIKTKYHSFALITVDLRQLISQYLYIDDLNVGNRTVSVPIDNFRFFQRAIEDCHLIYDGFIARFEGTNGFTAEISCSLYYIGSSSIEWEERYFNFNYDAEKQMLTYSITATTKYTDFKQ